MDVQLVLDPAIRDWVVLPMVAIMVMVGVGRVYVQQIIKSEAPVDVDELRYKQTAMRAQKLRHNGAFVSDEAFHMRKAHFNRKKEGALREKVPGMANPMMSSPTKMVDMLKNNMTFMIPNVVVGGFISYFFAGFVLAKVPFPLTNRFKAMLQRGVDLTTLDVSYVSSLSLYFLMMFGLRSFYRLLLGDDSELADETRMMQMQMGMGGGAGGMGFDAQKVFRAERDNLELVKHSWEAEEAEKRLLGDKYPSPSIDLLDKMTRPSKRGAGEQKSRA